MAAMEERAGEELAVYCKSLGCPKNRVDTEKFIGQLGSRVRLTDNPGEAHLVFVNTCGFIEPAVRESVRTILDLAGEKNRALLCVAGCLVGRYGTDSLASGLPEVDLWLEPAQREQWGEMVLAALGRDSSVCAGRLVSTPPSYAYLKVAEGCRHRCAFCTIPSIRGPLHSAPMEELLAEARTLACRGTRELVLIAQDLSDYAHDLGGDANAFPELLRRLGDIDGIAWLRMLYLYPRGITRELLQAVRDIKPLLPYFDIPLQHSHPDILRSMGRPFAVEPERVLESIREVLPEAALRTTFIVGYPGETDEHFRHLYDFVERMRFTQLGVFTFWPEEGTVAASLPNQVEDSVKEERRAQIMELQQEISRERLEAEVGSVQDVLVDSVNPEWPGLHNGRVWFQAPDVDGICYVSGPGTMPGAMVQADIVECGDYDLTALAREG
ncbi:MAG: 30S ribosomal protein S12 methylthiotransferase RimO [Candidatus Desulfovibrio faecigallinarum]|nr:30S ribosomal protein S12 methylthiotransferase RimO [Candidatus Desulfovibrio faecigallinarum]